MFNMHELSIYLFNKPVNVVNVSNQDQAVYLIYDQMVGKYCMLYKTPCCS